MDDDELLAAFELPGELHNPADLAARLLTYPEHRHLADNEISIGYMMRMETKEKGGKFEAGSANDVKHMAQGAFKDLFEQLLADFLGFLPQFIIVLDAGFWVAASDMEREALLFHELMHIQQKVDKYGSPKFDIHGNPSYGIKEHDVTAFNAEVARYGAWSPDLVKFAEVLENRP